MCQECESFGGLGWVVITDESGHDSTKPCICQREKMIREAAGLPLAYRECTWENWEEIPELAENVAWLKTWDGDPPLVILYSRSSSNLGSGKTRALANMVRMWRSLGLKSKYMAMADVIVAEKAMMDGFQTGAMGQYECMDYDDGFNVGKGLLALDDVGSEHHTDWSASVFETIVDARYSNRRPLLCATNFDKEAMRSSYPRSWSRFYEGKWLEWNAPDFRRKHGG